MPEGPELRLLPDVFGVLHVPDELPNVLQDAAPTGLHELRKGAIIAAGRRGHQFGLSHTGSSGGLTQTTNSWRDM